jgi:subtilisin-like proprotein convertase family protein
VREGRRFSRFADLGFYRSSYGDLASLNNEQLFEHLRNNGVAEGRATSQFFDVSYYLANNSDLRAAGFNFRRAYEHFVLIGFPREGRYGTPNGYSGPVMDENEGTGTPIFLASEGNLGDYDVPPGDGGVNQWQQNFDGPWFATADVQFANGQTTQTIPLAIFGDGVVDGNDTITWRISDSAPFGFSQESYTFSEDEANNQNNGIVPIQLSLNSTIKTATITIEDTNSFVTFTSTNVPQPINDSSTITSDLLVSDISGVLVDADVMLNITHTNDEDLDVFLNSPTGARVELFQDVGGNGSNFTNTTLDDEAAISISLGATPFMGSFQPQGFLSNFDSQDPNGIWRLEITDDSGENFGTLNSWSITFTL